MAKDGKFVFRPGAVAATKMTPGGEVRIVDRKNFPVTTIAAAIVRLKPSGLREMRPHYIENTGTRIWCSWRFSRMIRTRIFRQRSGSRIRRRGLWMSI